MRVVAGRLTGDDEVAGRLTGDDRRLNRKNDINVNK